MEDFPSSSGDSFFNTKSTSETDGIVDDQNDESTVNQFENETPKRVMIKEIMADGSKTNRGEMELKGCLGFYSFASKFRDMYDGDDITEDEERDIFVHVLWPWHHYHTRYMDRDQLELDPRRFSWTEFSGKLEEICVEKEPVGTAGYSLAENDQNGVVNKLQIIFREVTNVTRTHIREIDRNRIGNFRSFVWIVHTFWAGWRCKEPLDPDMVNDFNMVLEESASVEFFDENNETIEIPTDLSLNNYEVDDAIKARSSSEDEEQEENELGGDDSIGISAAELSNSDDEDAEISDQDENGEEVVDCNVNQSNEEVAAATADKADLGDNNVKDTQNAKNFLQKVTKVVIVKRRRV